MNEVITPVIQNLALTLADTEYTLTLPGGCQHFSFQPRGDVAVRFAFVTGKVAASTAPYLTCKPGQAISSPEKMSLKAGSETIYLASSVAGTVIEILTWTK